MIVDIAYYTDTYIGAPVPEALFPRVLARALSAVDTVTRRRVTEDNIANYPDDVQTAYRNAVCAQIEYLIYNGVEAANDGASSSDYTLGRISVSNNAYASAQSKAGNRLVCAQSMTLLEISGLLNPSVPTFGGD